MKIIKILLLIPSIAFCEFNLKDDMIQPFKLENQNMTKFISDFALIIKKPLMVEKETIKGEVNFSISKPISLEDLKKMFRTVLSSQGMTVLEHESFLKIIPEKDIRYAPTEYYASSDVYPIIDQYILVKHELKNPLGSEITMNIRPFLSRYGRIINFSDGHTIILSEKGRNIKRIIEIINNLDNEFDLAKFVANKKKKQGQQREILQLKKTKKQSPEKGESR